MSKRLTKCWVNSVQHAYGLNGKKGRAGETFFIKAFKKKGWKAIDHYKNRKKQLSGVDVTLIKNDISLTVDVKANMKLNKSIVIEVQTDGWLFNTKKVSDTICHINKELKMAAIYPRSFMQNYILEKKYNKTSEKIIYLEYEEIKNLPFIKWYTL